MEFFSVNNWNNKHRAAIQYSSLNFRIRIIVGDNWQLSLRNIWVKKKKNYFKEISVWNFLRFSIFRLLSCWNIIQLFGKFLNRNNEQRQTMKLCVCNVCDEHFVYEWSRFCRQRKKKNSSTSCKMPLLTFQKYIFIIYFHFLSFKLLFYL